MERKYAAVLRGLLNITESTLETIEYLSMKSSTPKKELNRQITMAQTGTDSLWEAGYLLELRKDRLGEVAKHHNYSVKDWVDKI